MELIDESEHTLLDQKMKLVFQKPELCAHLFHKNCLVEWFARDTSCPQCRLRVDGVVEFDERGIEVGRVKVTQVFLEDILEKEEDEEDEEEEQEEERTQTPLRRPRPTSDEEERIDAKVLREVESMRKRLAEERTRELRRQKAILSRVDPLLVRLSIIRSLRRLPYNLQTDDKGPSVQVPTLPKARPKAATFSFINVKKPRYEKDFLSNSKG